MKNITRTFRLFLAVTARAVRRESRRAAPATHEPGAIEWRRVANDPACWIYALLTIIAVVASSPSTWAIAAQFHAGTPAGLTQTSAWVVLFEIGAVASLASVLLVPRWHRQLSLMHAGQLLIVAIANYRAGATVQPEAFWLDLVIFAGAVPGVTFVFSWLFVARAGDVLRRPLGGVEALLRQARDRAMHVILERQLAAIDGLLIPAGTYARDAAALPEQASYPAPRLVSDAGTQATLTPNKVTRTYACPSCGTSLSQGQYGAARRHGRCKSCPPSQQNGLDAG